MNELNEKGGQKCPVCGKQTMAISEFMMFEPQSYSVMDVRKWAGVDCEHIYLEILACRRLVS